MSDVIGVSQVVGAAPEMEETEVLKFGFMNRRQLLHVLTETVTGTEMERRRTAE